MTSTRLRITWIKSGIGYSQRQKETIRALGFRHLGTTVEQDDTPTIRGMINKVSHLVRVEVTQGEPLPAQGGDLHPGPAGRDRKGK